MIHHDIGEDIDVATPVERPDPLRFRLIWESEQREYLRPRPTLWCAEEVERLLVRPMKGFYEVRRRVDSRPWAGSARGLTFAFLQGTLDLEGRHPARYAALLDLRDHFERMVLSVTGLEQRLGEAVAKGDVVEQRNVVSVMPTWYISPSQYRQVTDWIGEIAFPPEVHHCV